jgi:hypothetical protein
MEISFLVFFLTAGQGILGTDRHRGDFVAAIRAELPASVEKSESRGSRTNVVFKFAAVEVFRPAPYQV